jgi:uncharacterized protein (DUF2062 family)
MNDGKSIFSMSHSTGVLVSETEASIGVLFGSGVKFIYFYLAFSLTVFLYWSYSWKRRKENKREEKAS